jgi:4'-phosphopantetheinyl transferase
MEERDLQKLTPILAPTELGRMDSFKSQRSRQCFAMVHVALRILLGRYTGIHPAAIQFSLGEHGKPVLTGNIPPYFNLTHSDSLAALAFAADVDIGIDVERIRPITDAAAIASSFFAEGEAAQLSSLPPSESERAFFLCWTRKEALLKATGLGLSVPLDTFQVNFRPGQEARLIAGQGQLSRPEDWQLQDLALAPGYAGAIAYMGPPHAVRVNPTLSLTSMFPGP